MNIMKLIDQYERVVLNKEPRDVFLDALAHPPAPNDKLLYAAEKHRTEEIDFDCSEV